MRGAADSVDPDEVHALVAGALAQLEEPAQVQNDGVRLSKWPTVRISIDRAMVFPSASESEAWTAWVDLTFMYNTALPFTAARTHVVGLGNGRAEAVSDAVENWRMGVAPALISYIYGILKADADTWPPDHARSVPGWICINGPYVLRGDAMKIGTLTDFLQKHPLLGPVRERLAAALDKGAPLHTVSLYRAQTSSETFADVLIDNQPDVAAGELLKLMSWPKQLEESPFIAARHFLLCISASDVQERHAGGGLAE
jgi:hypothetical protein